MGKFAGSKVAGSHSAAIPAADPIVREALRRPEVTKVILGPMRTGQCRGAAGLKIVDMDAGLECTVRGNTGVQKIYVYTNNRHATASALQKVAPEKRGKTKKKPRKEPQELIDPSRW